MNAVLAATLALAALAPISANANHDVLCGIALETPGAPAGAVPCDGVRPGGRLLGGCTLNFVFAGSDGRTYIGSAGHCAAAEGEEHSWSDGSGPVARDMHGERVGTYAFATNSGPRDFALIRLDPDVPADPQVAHFGGPTSIYTGLSPEPAVFGFVGWGRLADPWPATAARPIAVASVCDHEIIYGFGPVAGGDSGAPVVDEAGRAVGVQVGYVVDSDTDPACPAEGVRITRLAPQSARAAGALGIALTLVTAPSLR